MSYGYVKAILIDGTSRLIQEIEIAPSHIAIEEEIGTRYWTYNTVPHRNGDRLYYHEASERKQNPTYKIFGLRRYGSGLIVGLDGLGMLRDANTPVEQVKKLVTWVDGHDATDKAAKSGI
jgi:hypothetical protein